MSEATSGTLGSAPRISLALNPGYRLLMRPTARRSRRHDPTAGTRGVGWAKRGARAHASRLISNAWAWREDAPLPTLRSQPPRREKLIPASKTRRIMRATSFRLAVRQRWWIKGGADRKAGRRSGRDLPTAQEADRSASRPVEHRGGAGPWPLIVLTKRGQRPGAWSLARLGRVRQSRRGRLASALAPPRRSIPRACPERDAGAEGKRETGVAHAFQTTGRRSVG
jgi:hypothetical protein